MKNNFFKFLLIFLFVGNISQAQQFKFETTKIELADKGNLIYATDGKAISNDDNLEIQAEKFEYTKNTNVLKAFKGVAYFKLENLKIQFDEIVSNQSTLITTASNNIEVIDLTKNITVKTNSLSFDKKINVLESKTPSTLKDNLDNIITVDTFLYNLNDGIIKLKNASLQDFENNIFKIDFAFINTITNELIGNDIVINLNNKSFNKNNDPRIKGKSISMNKDTTEITKGVFTTCKKTDKCPPWQISAKKIQHLKDKQIINYKSAFLKVYDIPVMYFPKFFHPDPTVVRKSGFLIPTIKNSPNGNSYFSLPYFSVISQNKDLTFTPRFFTDNKFLLQTEYRQKNKDSNHIADVSLLNDKNESSKTHFFYKYNKLVDLINFEDGDLKLLVEKTSNDTYLKGNKLSSPLINSYDVLENSLSIDLYSPDLSINSEIKVYEKLGENTHDKYEFIFPKLNLVKRFENNTELDGNFKLKTRNFVRSYETNILEKINVNDFIFNSSPKITSGGFYNNYDFIIKNANSDTHNSSNYKEDENFYVSGLFQFNSSLPLVKENSKLLNILKPKLAFKISPDMTKDLSKKEGKRLDVNNIYNLNRLSVNETLEGGSSLTYGTDFSIFDKQKSRDIFGLKIANNFRLQKNEDLPRNNQLDAKNSNFFSEFMFSPNEILTAKYNASTKNNLTEINYENFTTEISLNNFVTTFDYLNENNNTENNSYLSNSTKFSFDEANSIKFSTRENKSSNLTEFYNLIYEYKNDCLSASIEYNKDYYDDKDVKPEENIFFKLTIIPFGETSSPNLKN